MNARYYATLGPGAVIALGAHAEHGDAEREARRRFGRGVAQVQSELELSTLMHTIAKALHYKVSINPTHEKVIPDLSITGAVRPQARPESPRLPEQPEPFGQGAG